MTVEEYYAQTTDAPSALAAMKILKRETAAFQAEILAWLKEHRVGEVRAV